jgi:hypothetical protein
MWQSLTNVFTLINWFKSKCQGHWPPVCFLDLLSLFLPQDLLTDLPGICLPQISHDRLYVTQVSAQRIVILARLFLSGSFLTTLLWNIKFCPVVWSYLFHNSCHFLEIWCCFSMGAETLSPQYLTQSLARDDGWSIKFVREVIALMSWLEINKRVVGQATVAVPLEMQWSLLVGWRTSFPGVPGVFICLEAGLTGQLLL